VTIRTALLGEKRNKRGTTDEQQRCARGAIERCTDIFSFNPFLK
jgi:hypothetical protein